MDSRNVENAKKQKAMIQLLQEIDEGIRSGEAEGWISEEALAEHFNNRKTP